MQLRSPSVFSDNNFCAAHWKTLACLCCDERCKKIIQWLITAIQQPTAMLQTGRCPRKKIRPCDAAFCHNPLAACYFNIEDAHPVGLTEVRIANGANLSGSEPQRPRCSGPPASQKAMNTPNHRVERNLPTPTQHASSVTSSVFDDVRNTSLGRRQKRAHR